MDPSSAASSIDGLLAASGQVIELLRSELTPDGRRALSNDAERLLSEVLNSRALLSSLQNVLQNPEFAPRHRRDLIQLDELVAVLTAGVLQFAELEALVLPTSNLDDGRPHVVAPRGREETNPWRPARDHIPSQDGVQWVGREQTVAAALSRFRSFRTALILILHILEAESDENAVRMRRELSTSIAGLLEHNTSLSRRVSHRGGETGLSGASNLDRIDEDDTASDASTLLGDSSAASVFGSGDAERPAPSAFRRQFEDVLDASRPYRLARRGTIDGSARGSISGRSSLYPRASLSAASARAAVALPIRRGDLADGHRYTFGLDVVGLAAALPPFEHELSFAVAVAAGEKEEEGQSGAAAARRHPRNVRRASGILPRLGSGVGAAADAAERLALAVRQLVPAAAAGPGGPAKLRTLSDSVFASRCADAYGELIRRQTGQGVQLPSLTIRRIQAPGHPRLSRLSTEEFQSLLSELYTETERRKAVGFVD